MALFIIQKTHVHHYNSVAVGISSRLSCEIGLTTFGMWSQSKKERLRHLRDVESQIQSIERSSAMS